MTHISHEVLATKHNKEGQQCAVVSLKIKLLTSVSRTSNIAKQQSVASAARANYSALMRAW